MENCYRGLRRNQTQENPNPPFLGCLVYETSVMVALAVIFSTVIIIVVFAPIFTLTGVEGRIFAPMGWAYLLSIVASTLAWGPFRPPSVLFYWLIINSPKKAHLFHVGHPRLYRPRRDLSGPDSPTDFRISLSLLRCLHSAVVPSLGRVFCA
ncbi:efflux RND transporter permease subunit [Limnospira platensis]